MKEADKLSAFNHNEQAADEEPDTIPADDEYDSDVYIFHYEDKALEQYKGIHPGISQEGGGLNYSCPETGAHFEF